MKYIINYSNEDKLVVFPDDARLELSSVKAGDKESSITVLSVFQGEALVAAFVGIMRFYPVDTEGVDMEGTVRNWARD